MCKGFFEPDENEQLESLGLPISDEIKLVDLRINAIDIVAWVDGGYFEESKTCVVHLRNGKSFWILAPIELIDALMF